MTAPAIPLCPTTDTHPATCPCPRRSAETYYGHPIATTPDISTYQEQHVTQPEPTDQPLAEPDNPTAYALARHIADYPVSTFQAAMRYLGSQVDFEIHEVDLEPPCDHRCNCGHDQKDHSARYCGRCQDPCNSSGHYAEDCDRTIPDAASQSRPAPDNPAASGDAADNPGGTCDCTGSSAGLNACVACPTPWPDIPGATRVKRAATAPRSVADGVRAAAQVAVDSVAKALGATREEFALTGQIQPSGPNLEIEAENASQVEDGELTAEEARALADQLGLDLYRAQDALAFVEECCVIADREGQPVTTAHVRQWLQGAKCGRQLLADAAATPHHAPAAGTCPGVELKPNPCTCSCEGCRHHCGAHQPVAARRTLTDLREQYAAAIREVCGDGPWEVIVQRSTDAIMAIRDDDMDATEEEMERRGRVMTGLQAQLQRAVATLRNTPDLLPEIVRRIRLLAQQPDEDLGDAPPSRRRGHLDALAVIEDCQSTIDDRADAALSERAQAAIRQLQRQVEVRDQQLAAVRQLSTDLTADAEQMRGDEADNLRKIARLMREALGETSGGEPSP